MLTSKEAYKIAVAEFAPLPVGDKRESKTHYYFDAVNPNGGEIIGGYFISVRKSDGIIERLTIPPISNLRKWQNAKPF